MLQAWKSTMVQRNTSLVDKEAAQLLIIQVAIDELDRGEGEPLDMVAIKAEVAENRGAREDAS